MSLLTKERILELFGLLNAKLEGIDVKGEVGICGGAVMCLVFNARRATKDVDAIFEPTVEIRTSAVAVARETGLPEDWLNDAAKLYFHVDPPREPVLELSHLRVWAPGAGYMLAMKCISARFDSSDLDDVRFLIDYLGLDTPEQVLSIIEKYYPHKLVPAKSRFMVEEILSE